MSVSSSILLSERAHKGQLYGNEPYFDYHIQGVVKLIIKDGYGSSYIQAGYLHDVLEDSDITIENFRSAGISEEVIEAVFLLTKTKEQNRSAYITQCKNNPIARVVKLKDATFNCIESLKDGNYKRAEYYFNTVKYLEISK